MKSIGLWSEETLLSRYRRKTKYDWGNPEQKLGKIDGKDNSNVSSDSDSNQASHKISASQDPKEEPIVNADVGKMASNNWVISGKHTKTGKPLLSSDPHLGTGIPSFWTIQHLEFPWKGETKFMAGSSNPGVPGVLIGRTQHLSWGITAALSDVSDLFKE